MPKELLISGIGLALFIVCPRMAGMVYIIAKHSHVSLVYTALFGSIVTIPLVIAMVLLFAKFVLWLGSSCLLYSDRFWRSVCYERNQY